MNRLVLYLLLLFCIAVSVEYCTGQEAIADTTLKNDFDSAQRLLNSFKVDSAKNILNNIAEQLGGQDALNTEFGMNVLLRLAESWENDHDDQKAIRQLLELIKKSEEKKFWDIYSEANISLARLYEKLGLGDKCIYRLRLAQEVVKKRTLENIKPRLCIRLSSYHRVFRNDLDSARYYALQSLASIPKGKLSIHEGTANLLLALIDFHDSPNSALKYYEKAGDVFRKLEDYTGYSFVLIGQSQIYLRQKKLQNAMNFNDKALETAGLAKAGGNEQYYVQTTPLKIRAEIFKEMKNLDSSWYYINKANELEVAAISSAHDEEIIEIEEKYNNDLKNQQLTQQERRLKLEAQRRYLIILGFVATLIFTAFVLYFYAHLRKSYALTKQQTQKISKTNEELRLSLKQQNMLQREVHHRVTNNLQTLISLLEIQAEKLTDNKAIMGMESLSTRIWSMAFVHEMLYRDQNLASINVQAYLEKLCGHLKGISDREHGVLFTINTGELYFNLQTLIPLGLIINELFTNSLKYAVPVGSTLKLSINLRSENDSFELNFRDNGTGLLHGQSKEAEEGLGLYLINSMVRQLNGQLKVENNSGVHYTIAFREVRA